jgi:hypothetical protein
MVGDVRNHRLGLAPGRSDVLHERRESGLVAGDGNDKRKYRSGNCANPRLLISSLAP